MSTTTTKLLKLVPSRIGNEEDPVVHDEDVLELFLTLLIHDKDVLELFHTLFIHVLLVKGDHNFGYALPDGMDLREWEKEDKRVGVEKVCEERTANFYWKWQHIIIN